MGVSCFNWRAIILKVNISHLIQMCLISVVSFELGLGAKIILCIDLSEHKLCASLFSAGHPGLCNRGSLDTKNNLL